MYHLKIYSNVSILIAGGVVRWTGGWADKCIDYDYYYDYDDEHTFH